MLHQRMYIWFHFLKAKKNGAKIVCIDPRETRTSIMSHWHLQPKPGTDSALALGMMNEIVKNNLHDKSFLKNIQRVMKSF